MKLLKHLYFVLIFILMSCADESIHSIGKIDFQVTEFFVTATNAIVEVSIPHPETNTLTEVTSISLVKENIDYEDYQNDTWHSNYVGGYNVIHNEDPQYKDKCIFGFNELEPSTTYYIVVTCQVKFDYEDKGESVIYYTGKSFTTKNAGDYSVLGKALCGYSKVERDKILLEVVLPENLSSYNNMTLYASEHKDMKDPILKSAYGLSFWFPTFPKMEYYFQLKGDFKVYLDENIYFIYSGETIDFENSIDFYSVYEKFGY